MGAISRGGLAQGDFDWGGEGGFTEGGLSCYQFPELRSAFKHVGIMTVVIKDTIFDK